MVQVEWKGGMAFEAQVPTGVSFVIDAHPDSGGLQLGPTPVEALLSSIAACSGMDVMLILRKKQQKVSTYRIEVEGVRPPMGEWPRPFLSITIRHLLTGENLDPVAVARAVELSDAKYCTVIATLRAAPEVKSEWQVQDTATQNA